MGYVVGGRDEQVGTSHVPAAVSTLPDATAILDGLDVGVIVLDLHGAYLYVNAATSKILGRPREALMGSPSQRADWTFVAEDGSVVGATPVIDALRRGETVHNHLLGLSRPVGEMVWLQISAARWGDTGLAIITFTDVTNERGRRTHAESARDLSDKRYEAVLRAMNEGLVIHDPSSAIRFANRGAERILGLTHDQLLGVAAADPRWRLVRADGSPLPAEDVPSEVTTRTGHPCRNRVIGVDRGDGARAWLTVSSDCIAGDGDPSAGVVATFTDITELREAQLALERSNARLRAVTQSIPGIIFQYTRRSGESGHFSFVSGRVRELLGVDEEVLTTDATTFEGLLHEESRASFVAARERSESELLPVDLIVRVGEAQIRWLRVRALPEKVDGGTSWTGVVLDETEQHNLAEGLRRSQRREAMGDLAAGLAHNFNNMLAVVLPNVEAARRFSAEEGRPLLDDAAFATKRAAELVKQLLYIARGDIHGPRGATDLVVIVAEVAELCRRTFDRNIEIDLAMEPSVALTRGTPGHLQQVVLNLCLNARDALRGVEAPRIELRLGAVPDARSLHQPFATATRHFVLTVRDNGEGMDEATQRRLGEPFFTTKEPGAGTGLGLATVFGTMRDIGGSIEVHSTPKRGTTFTLHFPLADAVLATP